MLPSSIKLAPPSKKCGFSAIAFLSSVMVDEEDEGVLTTEDLRVEVSRFLKGVGAA